MQQVSWVFFFNLQYLLKKQNTLLKRKETCLYPESCGAVTVKAHLTPRASAIVQSRTAAVLSLASCLLFRNVTTAHRQKHSSC